MRGLWLLLLSGCAFDSSSNGPVASMTVDGPLADALSVDAPSSDALHQPDAATPDAGARDGAPDSGCPQGCMPGSDPCCPEDCGPGQSCGAGAGGMHYFRCTGSDCNVICTGNTSCSVDCGGATGQCALSCSGSQASCMVQCQSANDCPLACNPQSVMLCGTDVKVCGRACP